MKQHWACRDADFRSKFQAAIVSIRRQGHNLQGKLGDVNLQAGDELLFDCGDNFDENSPTVKSNLDLTGLVQQNHAREFMFAFKVQGTSILHHIFMFNPSFSCQSLSLLVACFNPHMFGFCSFGRTILM
jgi:hypothetical protein